MKYILSIISTLFIAGYTNAQHEQPIYTSKAYSIYPDRVVQGRYTASAVTATELTSDYQSPANLYKSALVDFKFSINGKDNEMIPGQNHHFYCASNNGETSLIKFGEKDVNTTRVEQGHYLEPNTRLKIRLDMRSVLSAFKTKGYYTLFNGEKLYKNDFKGVYVAGSSAPLIWDFNNLVNHQDLELKDPDGDGIYETTLILNFPANDKTTSSSWRLSRDVSAFPQYHSDYKISDALYNLALDEMQHAIEPDSTFRTGKEWSGVWTRDISYSIILSMAILQPKVAIYSLMRKVKDGFIIQDTGTGGAYPVSSDRMIWAVAAWEVYKVTGDREWLNKAYSIIRKSAANDVVNVYDNATGLVKGESSFLDWREQTYPKWMQPADIYESECLGTNVVHYRVNKVLAEMAGLLNEKSDEALYNKRAETIRSGIEKHLWIAERGYYGQYLYGRNSKILSPRSEALGEALSVFFDVSDHAKEVISKTPVTDFGIPCIYPQISDIPPYHNDAVWPFVQSFWALASAKAGNEKSVMESIAAIYRPAAMFLTNKENFVVNNGDYAGTQINSSNMLWSLSGNLSLVYRLLFGISYTENSMQFKPFVPKNFAGKRTLENYKYRDAYLNIELNGYGSNVKSFKLDGRKIVNAIIPADLKGRHNVYIELDNTANTQQTINKIGNLNSIATPEVSYSEGTLSWSRVNGAFKYRVLNNGKLLSVTNRLTVPVSAISYGEYQVIAVDAKGRESFASEPVQVIPGSVISTIELEDIVAKASLPYQGFSGAGFINICKTENIVLNIPVKVAGDGTYAIEFRYANGNGPINTENKCAIRTLELNGQFVGAIVLPQRGKGEWSNWGFTNVVKVNLKKGTNELILKYQEANSNMNGDVNQALLDCVRIVNLSH